MMPEHFEIEVEYNLQERKRRFSEIPMEYRELLLKVPAKRPARQSKFLLLIADSMIKTGNAIKNAQIRVSDQKIYS